MNGIHDLGGMHGFGPVEREENEPAFHARWEAALWAINGAARRWPLFNIDEFRHGIERMDPAHYLSSTYYEHWLDGITRVLLEKGAIAPDELDARTQFFLDHPDAPASAAVKEVPSPGTPRGDETFRREGPAPRFQLGDAVLTRNMHPPGHTRMPRYARGKHGVVERVHGVFVFPDTNADGQGEQPQGLYSVRFTAEELWGDSAEGRGSVNMDLWDSYLLLV